MLSKVGEIYEGKVTGITNFGAFIRLENGETGMVHISEVAPVFVKDITSFLSEGQTVKVKVLSVGENNKISLSIKQAQPSASAAAPAPESPKKTQPRQPAPADRKFGRPRAAQSDGPMTFEDMMAKFKADSEEKMSALKRSTDMGRGSRRGNKS
jgi:S1 RNA binding domain protein